MQEINLEFFTGFYESIHNSYFESEEDYILEDTGKPWDEVDFTYDFIGYSQAYVNQVNRILGLNLKFKELISPREYNFTTDKIICYISQKDIKKIAEYRFSDTMRELVKDRFTSRSGFISFYSHNLDEWNSKELKEWDSVELGTLLDVYIKELGNEDIDYQCFVAIW